MTANSLSRRVSTAILWGWTTFFVSGIAVAEILTVKLQSGNIDVASKLPLNRIASGSVPNRGYVDGIAYTYSEIARADYGSLSTFANIDGHSGLASATAGFSDEFTIFGPSEYRDTVEVVWSYDIEGFLSAGNSSPTGPRGEAWTGIASVSSTLTIADAGLIRSDGTHSVYTQIGGLTGDAPDTTVSISFFGFVGHGFSVSLILKSTAEMDNIACRTAAGYCDVPGQGFATSDYSHTLLVNPPQFFDVQGNELFGFSLISASGTDYASLVDPEGPGGGTVPEPGTMLLLVAALAAIRLSRKRRR